MDSLTQIVLGASIGEAVLGRKIGNKAMLYGAIGGTIPDLDVLASLFTDTVTALTIHRGFTHSIVFSLLMSPFFSWLVTRYENFKNFKHWCFFFFMVFITHPILDAHTTWGTQLFWPLDIRLAFKTIFVIDPIYTLPFLIFTILAAFQNKTSPKRRFYNGIGLSISTFYLVLSFFSKSLATQKFENALMTQNIEYIKIDTRPSALNTILWNANVELEDAFLLSDYSFFDSQSIEFERYPKNHHLINDLIENERVLKMIDITNGWFTINKDANNNLFFNDLRFGLLDVKKGSENFVFQYKIEKDNNDNVTFTEVEKNREDAQTLLKELWKRIKGN